MYTQTSPIPGLMLITLLLIVWGVRRFARNHQILVRAAWGLIFLWLLALVAPRALVWFQRRLALAKQALDPGPPPSTTARHRAAPYEETRIRNDDQV